jgi:Ni,Fe-hydrogenase III large subunit
LTLHPPELLSSAPEHWRARCEEQAAAGGRFCGLFASHPLAGRQARAVFAHPDRDVVIWTPVRTGAIDTLVDLFPAAGQDEREAHDSYGVRFHGHEPLRPMLEHTAAPESWTVPVHGHGPHQVAVGPIHAGVIESGHFRFTVVGERILHLDLRLFYKHRGLQLAAEGHRLAEGLRYAQRACAACAVTNSVAYAQACESLLGMRPDDRLRCARTLLLELERLYNHLGDISAICSGVGFAPGMMAFATLKEHVHRLNRRLAGHRFLFDTVRLGESTLRIDASSALSAREELRQLGERERSLWRELTFAASVQDRLAGIGALSRQEALDLGAVGPSARAAAVAHDVRSESPRLLYEDFRPVTAQPPTGDVLARLQVRQLEIGQTFQILDRLLSSTILPGQASRGGGEQGAIGVSRVESPRGETLCVVDSDGERVQRLHLRTGSYANWPALAHAVREDLLPDFPLINKSFELCYACVDR